MAGHVAKKTYQQKVSCDAESFYETIVLDRRYQRTKFPDSALWPEGERSALLPGKRSHMRAMSYLLGIDIGYGGATSINGEGI